MGRPVSLSVLITEGLAPGLRGAIAKWMVELAPGTYIGSLSARVRTELWGEVANWVLQRQVGYAALVYPAQTEQGFAVDSLGDTRYNITDFDGIALVSRQHETREIRAPDAETYRGW